MVMVRKGQSTVNKYCADPQHGSLRIREKWPEEIESKELKNNFGDHGKVLHHFKRLAKA